jgi:hypothetical protein
MKGSKRKRKRNKKLRNMINLKKRNKKLRNMINLKTVRSVEKGLEDGQRKYY